MDNTPVIAPFFADIDTTFQGNISVREINDTQRALNSVLSLIISESFQQSALYSIYNVSWEGVARNSENPDTVSTDQLFQTNWPISRC